jgi:molybdopterin synthase sulfur carrier subunit
VPADKSLRILYFAAFHEAAGRREETWVSGAGTAADLYDEVAARYRFRFDRSVLQVARNDELVSWDTELKDGDSVAFLAPFAGG